MSELLFAVICAGWEQAGIGTGSSVVGSKTGAVGAALLLCRCFHSGGRGRRGVIGAGTGCCRKNWGGTRAGRWAARPALLALYMRVTGAGGDAGGRYRRDCGALGEARAGCCRERGGPVTVAGAKAVPLGVDGTLVTSLVSSSAAAGSLLLTLEMLSPTQRTRPTNPRCLLHPSYVY